MTCQKIIHFYKMIPFFFLASCLNSPLDHVENQQKIQSILRLNAIEYDYRMVVWYDNTSTLWTIIPIGAQELLFSINTKVRSGYNLDKGFILNPDPLNPRSITLHLAEPEILSVDADESSIRQYYIKQWGKPLDWRAVSAQIEEGKQRAREEAKANGILQKTQEYTQNMLSNFLSLLGYQTVRFALLEQEEN